MESNAMSAGGMYSTLGSGMLGLEMSLHHHHIPNNQNSQNPKTTHMQQQQNPHHPMVAYAHHHDGEIQQQPQVQLSSAKQGGYNNNNNNPFATKSKNIQSLTLSDEEEPGGGGGGSLAANENSADDGKRKTSPWQRMKWTDNMVRLLIMVVYYIGDEVGSEGNDPIGSGSGSGIGKKKIGGGGGGGVLQKKGKWKSVSRAMMERGFYVSPQQCEDKFNDLNKRYKRVNDILGKGTACRVVENQNLLNTMDHLSPKMKEEAKKLLNSKHLFFREMCAYHNSCSHGPASVTAAASACAQQSPEVAATELSHQSIQQHQSPQPQPRCLHSTENTTSNFNTKLTEEGRNRRGGEEEMEEETSDEDEDGDDYEEEDDDDIDGVEGGGGGAGGREEEDDDVDDTDGRCGRKKKKRRLQNGNLVSPLIQQLSTELRNVIGDERKSGIEKRQWMRNWLIKLEEEHVGYEYQAFELEKQRLKWVKYSSKKEREMEMDKISNERKKLENERMSLLIRQKEIELLDLYHQTPRKSDPSSVTG